MTAPVTASGESLPRFRAEEVADPARLARRLNEFVTSLEGRLTQLEGPLVDPREPAIGEEAYEVTNATEKRAFDADTVTLAELADVVGTFLDDLHNEAKLR